MTFRIGFMVYLDGIHGIPLDRLGQLRSVAEQFAEDVAEITGGSRPKITIGPAGECECDWRREQ